MNAPPMAPPPQMTEPSSIVELTISCTNLPDLDVMSKSDPMCVVFAKRTPSDPWFEVGRTETIQNNLNPEFSKKITMTYLFEERQLLKFEVYDIDSASKNLSDHDFMGRTECALGEIVSCAGLVAFERDLTGSKKTGAKIKVIAEELASFREAFTIELSARNLPKKMFGSSSFFYEIHKGSETGTDLLVYRSDGETAKGADCHWKSVQLKAHTLCNGDNDRNLKVSLYKYKSNGSHRKLGDWNCTVKELLASQLPFQAKAAPSSCLIVLNQFQKDSHSTFLDFIKKG